MPKLPMHMPSPLPQDEALRLANLARVPPEQQEQFFDLLHWTVTLVWMRDRRALGTKAGTALDRAAQAARTLHEAVGDLNRDDREWVENLWARTPWYKEWLRELPGTGYRLAHLFSTAVGKSPPRAPGEPTPPHQKTKRGRTLKDVIFRDFVRRLWLVAAESGGNFTFDKNQKKGTLIDAIDILGPHLPKDVVPIPLPFRTIQRIKTNFDAPLADIDIFHAE
jgi:hypothetical protein